MARTNTFTLTADELNNIIAQAVATAMSTQKATPSTKSKGSKAPTKADLSRKDGTVGKDGRVWLVTSKGERKWVSQSSYDYVQKKRAYASGEIVRTEHTQAEKDAYKKAYAKEWAKWQKLGKHTSAENKAKHAEIVAMLKK